MPIKKLLPDSAIHEGLSAFKPKSNSVYLGIVVFDNEQQILLSPNQQLPTLPLFTRDRLAYHGLTLNSPNFHAIIQWSQLTNTSQTMDFINHQLPLQQRNFINHFVYIHSKLMQHIGCDHQQGSFYRHILEFQRPSFKLLLILYPFHSLSFSLAPLSRNSRLHWYPSKDMEHLQFLSQHVTTTRPSTKLWRQPQSVHYAQTSRLPRGLYLALFYCQSSPPNNQRGLQIFLEKNHEHRLPCVPLRHDTQISNMEWEWLQTLAGRPNDEPADNEFTTPINNITMETYDFLTKEMQQKQQQKQLDIQQQLEPFKQALRQGRNQLQTMAGVPIHLKDLFSEDSLCMIYEGDMKAPKEDDDDDENDDNDSLLYPQKTLKKKTLSIADMFSYGQQQTQHGWNRPVHVRMLVIVKPLCITPDFPVQPNFDFYPYHVFRTLQQDKMQFASASLESLPPRRQPQHHVSMSDLLNNTIQINASSQSIWHGDDQSDNTHVLTKRRSFCTTTLLTPPETQQVRSSMALFYQDKDMKGWAGRLLEFDRQRTVQHPSIIDTSLPHRTSRITSTCSLPITFDTTTTTATTADASTATNTPSYNSPSLSKRLKRWCLARCRKL